MQPDLAGGAAVNRPSKYSDRFGNANRMAIMLAVERSTIFNPKTLKKFQNIHRAVELLAGVNKNQLLSIACARALSRSAQMVSRFEVELEHGGGPLEVAQ